MSEPQKVNNLSWMIGGAQGSGVDSSANIFARACVLAGLWVYGTREYYSNIKGLHSYFEMRVSDKQIRSKIDEVDLLVTFDAETLIRHAEAVRPGGGIIYSPSLVRTEIEKVDTLEDNIVEKIKSRLSEQGLPPSVSGILDEAGRRGIQLFPVSYDQIISRTGQKIGETQLSKLLRIVNVLAVSASMAVLGLDEKYVEQAIGKIFAAKKKIIEMNVIGAGIAYDTVRALAKQNFSAKLAPMENKPRMFIAGNQAVGLGKIVGGCRMQTYYPITPASDESEFLESHENFGLVDGSSPDGKGSMVVVQTEDEISAVTMATGAALTGTRASTSTSGPGFCLMVEGMGWAGINEVPVVITLYSRGGPSTGMPTRTEQGDLQFALHASHGEFPRIVLSSGDMEECFYDSIRIFNYAERYQCPAIHMVDKALANSNMTILPLHSDMIPIERGKLIQNAAPPPDGETYLRFKFTEDGISPRAVLGMKGYRFWNSGDEHEEIGHICEDPENRVRMMTKRMTKLETASGEIPDSEKVNFFPATKNNADATIVSFGSSKGAILEAMELLRREGIDIEFLQLRLMSPFPTDLVKKRLSGSKLVIDIEQNYSGQLAALISEKTLIEMKNKILKFNGRPISRDEVYESVKQVVKKPEENKRVVLVHGA